jgi:hypothetical protein
MEYVRSKYNAKVKKKKKKKKKFFLTKNKIFKKKYLKTN